MPGMVAEEQVETPRSYYSLLKHSVRYSILIPALYLCTKGLAPLFSGSPECKVEKLG